MRAQANIQTIFLLYAGIGNLDNEIVGSDDSSECG
jgi:hypothetical protein